MALGHFEGESNLAPYFSGFGFLQPYLRFRDYSPPEDRCPRGYFMPRRSQYCRSCPFGTLWSSEGCVVVRW